MVLDRNKNPYLNTDRIHRGEPCLGRGEVWIRGPAVCSGYYVQEKKTREDFDENGWFHTGDIAIWNAAGQLKIVDRLKNLVKLKGGEYVAIESMEATYAQSVFVNGVNGGLMCYADGDMDRPVALVQVSPPLPPFFFFFFQLYISLTLKSSYETYFPSSQHLYIHMPTHHTCTTPHTHTY